MRNREPKTLWTAVHADELRAALNEANVDVPLRSEGRTADHAELYSIAHLLTTLSPDYFKFPVEVVHRDRPDFLVHTHDRRIGIEHVEVVPTAEAYRSVLREEGHGPEMHFVRPATPDEPVLSRDETIAEIEADDEGDGWVGDSAEEGWAEAVAHFINKKLERAAQPGFEAFDETWLLMYDNWPAPNIDPRKAARFLMALPGMREALNKFQRIFVMDGARIWEFTQTAAFHPLKRAGAEPGVRE